MRSTFFIQNDRKVFINTIVLFAFLLGAFILVLFLSSTFNDVKLLAMENKLIPEINGNVNSFEYNGSPANFTFTTNSDGNYTVKYYFENDESFAFEIDPPVNAGVYKVQVKVKETENFYAASDYFIFEISKSYYVGKNPNINNFSTTFEEGRTLQSYFEILANKYPLTQGYKFKEPNTIVNAGLNQKFDMVYNLDPTNYFDYEFEITMNVKKATIDPNMLTWASQDNPYKTENNTFYFKYDGSPKSVFIDGLNLITHSISYVNNNQTNIGEYIIEADINLSENYNPITVPTCKIVIEKGVLTQSEVNENLNFAYIDNTLTFTYLKPGFNVHIKLSLEDVYQASLTLNPNSYSIYYIITSDYYENFEGATAVNLESTSPNEPNNPPNDNNTTNDNNTNSENNNENTNNNQGETSVNNNNSKPKVSLTILIVVISLSVVVIIGTIIFIIVKRKRNKFL